MVLLLLIVVAVINRAIVLSEIPIFQTLRMSCCGMADGCYTLSCLDVCHVSIASQLCWQIAYLQLAQNNFLTAHCEHAALDVH